LFKINYKTRKNIRAIRFRNYYIYLLFISLQAKKKKSHEEKKKIDSIMRSFCIIKKATLYKLVFCQVQRKKKRKRRRRRRRRRIDSGVTEESRKTLKNENITSV